MMRYVITEVRRDGVQYEIGRTQDLAEALTSRDIFNRSSIWLYLVHDSEDPEGGYAEWLSCQKHGSFADPDGWCEKCDPPMRFREHARKDAG